VQGFGLFFQASGSGGFSNSSHFDQQGHATFKFTSESGIPLIIGKVVVSTKDEMALDSFIKSARILQEYNPTEFNRISQSVNSAALEVKNF